MPDELNSKVRLEIGHVLFLDIVGYSKLLISEQSERLQQLKEIVWATEQFRVAQAEGKLLRLPTGDGGALVFRTSPEAPVLCAQEISKALKTHPELPVRMGIHSGPVNEVSDLNAQANMAGAGINIAQRVMDCGDAGHILLSKRVADDIDDYPEWRPHLHDLGESEVKHGVRLHLFNLYGEDFGNPAVPGKVQSAAKLARRSSRAPWLIAAMVMALAVIAAAIFWQSSRRSVAAATNNATPQPAAPAEKTIAASEKSMAAPEKSIAVLPFENLSSDKENGYFADGVQDEILTDLAKIADLKVISRTSVMQYKTSAPRNLREIGQQLGVAHLLEGSVQRADKKVRVNAQLIDARTDAHQWAENFDRPLDDVFAIQSEIAKAIADQLGAKLSQNEKAAIEKAPTGDLIAYDLYLRARTLSADATSPTRGRHKLPEAARLLDKALARDPQFLLGWCLLANIHALIYWEGFDHTPARLELAGTAVQTALRLQPDAGEAHLASANYLYLGFRDYEGARAELALARRTLPNTAQVFEYTGYIDRRQGRWEKATQNLERALDLDPRNFYVLQQIAGVYDAQRRYTDEIRVLERALTIVPGDYGTRIYRAQVEFDWRANIKPFQTTLAAIFAENPSAASDADDDVGLALCERTSAAAARALSHYPRDGVVNNGVNFPLNYWEGVVARWEGDAAKAQSAFGAARAEVAITLEKQPDFAAALSLLGMIDAGLGRKDEALREGRRACELLPISKDALDGVAFAVNLAQIYAWVGEKDLAIEQIAAIERVPSYLSYGCLKLQPQWDSLRGDPRFEKILTSLAPKDQK